MHLVSGANLFGQWFSPLLTIYNFKNVPISDNVAKLYKFKPNQVKLIDINWSYNIFLIDENFYISGSWKGKDNQFIKLELPSECRQYIEGNKIESFTLVGNDHNIILINKETYMIWMINLEKEAEVKKIKLNIDSPIDTIVRKRFRIQDKIIKALVTNNNCLYLTEKGVMYSGFLPMYLNTSITHTGKICDIACGYDHCVMLTDTGRVYTWGQGRRCQLGHGDLTNVEQPVEVEALAGIKIVKICAGGWHSLALSEFGDVYAWGWNDTGQLGIKTQLDDPEAVLKDDRLQSYPQPTVVDLFDESDREIKLNVKDIACGSRHSAILTEDNSVWTSGNNKYGQLGFDPEKCPNVNYFRKSFQCDDTFELKCGLWCTVLIKKD